MRYEPSGAPLKVAMSIGTLGVVILLGIAGFQHKKTADLKVAVAQCAKSNGVESVDWTPMHGIHELYIGEQFVADTPERLATAQCAIQNSDVVVGNHGDGAPGKPATIEIRFSGSLLEANTIVFRPGSA